MFSWFRPKQPPVVEPKPCAANPGKGVSVRIAFANGTRTWEEKADLPEILERILKQAGHATTRSKGSVALESGLVLLPSMVSFQPLDGGGVRTVTTIETSHPDRIPPAVFEYQHATGNTTEASIGSGFDNWAKLDLPVFLDVLTPKPQTCTIMQMEFPADESGAKRTRQVFLGPVAHMMEHPLPKSESGEETHAFCPCCLFTNSGEAFHELLTQKTFHGIRFFALRDQNGEVSADCRVNGEDWPAGVEALRRYAASWPQQGYEFRKQFVVISSPPA